MMMLFQEGEDMIVGNSPNKQINELQWKDILNSYDDALFKEIKK